LKKYEKFDIIISTRK